MALLIPSEPSFDSAQDGPEPVEGPEASRGISFDSAALRSG